MAGLSSRFAKSGYLMPKYMLEAFGKSLFLHSISSFEFYFNDEDILFITLDSHNSRKFIEQECQKIGLNNYQIVVLNKPTRGQAETVYLGINKIKIPKDEDLLIFNIDTFRPGFKWPSKEFNPRETDGFLETFIGEGKNWSNVLPKDESLQKVKLTAEKKEISKYCCTGLYYWRYCFDYCRIFETYLSISLKEVDGGEYYIAPMYNYLIDEGKDIRYSLIEKDKVIFCGTPIEYNAFLSSKVL